MSNPNDNLLDFLKKKSLFNASPQNSRKRSRSKSRSSRNYDKISHVSFDEKERDQSSFLPITNPNPIRDSKVHFQLQSQFKPQLFIENKNTYSTYMPQPAENHNPPFHTNNYRNERDSSSTYQPQKVHNNALWANMSHHSINLYQSDNNQTSNSRNLWNNIAEGSNQAMQQTNNYNKSNNNIWSSMVSHTNTFQSARIESQQCLEDLSMKVTSEISNINFKLDALSQKMFTVVNREFKAVKEQLYQIFENAFKESEKYIAEYIRAKEEQLAGDIKRMKEILQRQQVRIGQMKEELSKPQWKKVAGEILSTEMQSKMEEILQKCRKIQIANWQFDDIGKYRIKNIQSQLRQIVRLRT